MRKLLALVIVVVLVLPSMKIDPGSSLLVLAGGDPGRLGLKNTVSIGTTHSAAIHSNGDLYTWGENGSGELGLGDFSARYSPNRVPSLSNVVAVSLGETHSAALTAGGDLYTWGSNVYGELGHGDSGWETRRYVPTKVASLSNVVAISMGSSHSAAITAGGALYIWGRNNSGELGLGDYIDRSTPTRVNALSDVTAIAMGAYHSAALTADGSLYTWGSNFYGPLLINALGNRNVPSKVDSLSNIVSISMGDGHSAAITAMGDLYTWGGSYSGQLGHGDTENKYAPTGVETLSRVITISLGGNHTAAIVEGGELYTWGSNNFGVLGQGFIGETSTPSRVRTISNVVGLSMGSAYSSALTSGGEFFIWGNNYDGQLGLGDIGLATYRNTPHRVMSSVRIPVLETVAPPTTLASAATGDQKVIIMTRDDPMMHVDGVLMEVDPGRDTALTIINGRAMVPIRAVVERMGGSIDYDASSRLVTIVYNNRTVLMTLDSFEVSVDGSKQTIDIAPTVINNRTMIPLRFTAESLGCSVEWLDSSQQVVITY